MNRFEPAWVRRCWLFMLLAALLVFGAVRAAAQDQDNEGSDRNSREQDSATPGTAAVYSQPDTAKRAEAYYNYAMAHYDEELYEVSGESEYANEAIEHYKAALALDPNSAQVAEGLAEIYAKSQRIGDAVQEAETVLKTDPNNIGAHRLLARIYVRTLGDLSAVPAQSESLSKAVRQFQEILRLDPHDTESALWLARLYRFQTQQPKAEEVLRGILKSDPENEPGLEQLSQLLLDQGRTGEAISLLQVAADHATSAGVFDLLGDAYLQTHQYPQAEAAYRKAMQQEPEEANHRRGLAQALLAEDKYKEALEQYQKLSQLEPDSAENYLRLSQIYRRMNKLDQAESDLLMAKQRAPGSLEVLYNEGLLYEAQGRFGDAVRILSDAIAGIKSQNGDSNTNALGILYEELGQVYRDKGDYESAIRAYQDMEKLGPSQRSRAQALLIDAYRGDRDIDQAIAETKKDMQASPSDQGLQVTYALLLGEKGQPEAGVKILRGMLHGGAPDGETYMEIAQVEERGKNYAEAEKAALTAESLLVQPAQKETAWFMLGAVYEREKKYDQAEQEFRKVIEFDAHNAAALNYYGYMLADRGIRLEEAVGLIKRALGEEPNNGAYLDSLGWAYYKQNNLVQAEEYLGKAAERESHDPTILDHLGDVYFKLGRTERAEALWERAQAEWQHSVPADYEPDRASQLDQKLANLKRRLAQKSSNDNKAQ